VPKNLIFFHKKILPWRERQCVPPERLQVSAIPHGVASPKTLNFKGTTMRILILMRLPVRFSRVIMWKIRDYHNTENSYGSIRGCDAVQFGTQVPPLRRKSPSTSWKQNSPSALTKGVRWSSENFIRTIYQTTRRHIPDHCNLKRRNTKITVNVVSRCYCLAAFCYYLQELAHWNDFNSIRQFFIEDLIFAHLISKLCSFMEP
jgi:hypothetical protein